MTEKVREGGPRRNAFSAKQSRGQKVWSAIQSNVSVYPIDKNTHHESTRQREATKYLRENYHHRIQCSVANSLATLMWK